MIDRPRRVTQMAPRGATMLIALVASLTALLAAFLLTLQAVSRYFDRAAAAQAQLADVSRIEALAASEGSGAELRAAVADYRASIDIETALLPEGARGAQAREAAEALRLSSLVTLGLTRGPDSSLGQGSGTPDQVRGDELRNLVAKIGDRERAEVAGVAAAMAQLRLRTTISAALLAASALAAALLGAFALARANRDLTQIVEARTADLSAVDRSRRLFFAKASHELRTPITAMRGEAEVSLADPDSTSEQLRESLAHVVAGTDFLGRRIDELLGLSKAEDGRLALVAEPVDLARVVAETAEAARTYARSAEVDIALSLPGERLPVAVDPRWLGQALLAVIDNGVKFSPQGAMLRLSVDVAEGQARIGIADSGPGVMETALPRIFDAYYQAEAGRMRGGTGLGLALARWVVEQHGGTIVAANDPGGGCTIAITLPIAEAA